VEFRILGPLEVTVAGQSLATGGARTRAVLALLLVNANQVVSADALADQLWPNLAADRAVANLQVRLSELRRALRALGEAGRLETRPPGYVLHVGPDELDVLRFEALVAAGRDALAAGDPDGALRLLDRSLALWRGAALADVNDTQAVSAEQTRLDEERLGALESRIDALLDCGRHQQTIAELEMLTTSNPLRERLWYQRLLALYRSGRQAEALRAYRELRSILVDQLGIEPATELRELEARILRHDPTLGYHPVQPQGRDHNSPQTRYVESGGVHIAYQVVGDGDRDILFVPGLMSHVELAWEDPGTVQFYRRLAGLGRLILFDKRDTGLSDRAPGDSTLEERMEDAHAVMNAAASERAIVFGYSEGAPMAILFAATYPEKVSALILGSGFARWFPAPDYPVGPGPEQAFAALSEIATHRWGEGATIDWFLPSRSNSPETRRALGRFERMAISPSAFLRMARMIRDIDVRAALPAIHAPSLVIHRSGDRINPTFCGRYIASHIPGARYFEQPGDHVLRFAEGEELETMFAEIEAFLGASRLTSQPASVLTTILRIDGVVNEASVAHVRAHRGRLRERVADGMLATFDAPALAIRCADAIRTDVAGGGTRLRAGIHTGEVELIGESVCGTSIEIAGDVAALAQPDEILVSRTVKDLVVGSGITFADRGSHELAGTPESWPLLAVDEV
jgi:DNA-binding SARP family transcriptional activator/pimeloyl-ACP methyl ester carboxylesterase